MTVVNLNKREHAAKTIPTMKKTRSQVAVAGMLAKKRTYLTTWLQSGCDPKLLSCAHTYNNQIVNTAVENIWIETRRTARKTFPERENLLMPASFYLVSA